MIADGLCAIDVVHKPGFTDDGARISQFLDAARAIIIHCVGEENGIDGGYVGDIGMWTVYQNIAICCLLFRFSLVGRKHKSLCSLRSYLTSLLRKTPL